MAALRRWLRAAVAALAFAWCAVSLADNPLTIVPLQHRGADAVAEALRPMLSPGGRIGALNGKLLIRTDAANLRQLQDALAAIDQPARRLRLRVRFAGDVSRDVTTRGLGGEVRSGTVTLGLPAPRGGSSATVRIGEAHVYAGEQRYDARTRGEQFVDTLDGAQASVFVGHSVALPFSQVVLRPNGVRVVRGTEYRDVGTALLAQPTLLGSRVRVVLRPASSQLRSDGSIEVTALENTVEGRLGEWIAVGGSDTDAHTERGVIGGSAQRSERSQVAFWLRVDALDDD